MAFGIEKMLASKMAATRLARLEKMYGPQIGKTAENGSMAFQKKVGNETITTGVKWNDKLISQVYHRGNNIKGSTKKFKYNNDGDIVEVSHSKRATTFRGNVTQNLETSEIAVRTFTLAPDTKYVVKTLNITPSGQMNSAVKEVRLKGKSSPLEQVNK